MELSAAHNVGRHGVTCECDSAGSVRATSRQVATSAGNKLSCFKGPFPIAGKLQLNVTMGGTTIQAELVLVDCPGPMLCSHDTIQNFNTAGVPLLSADAVAGVQADTTDRRSETLSSKYNVFAPDLGLLRGPLVHLNVREDARPHFCKAQTEPYALK